MKLDQELKLDFDFKKIDQINLIRWLLLTISIISIIVSFTISFNTYRAINRPISQPTTSTQAINQPLFKQSLDLINQNTIGLPR